MSLIELLIWWWISRILHSVLNIKYLCNNTLKYRVSLRYSVPIILYPYDIMSQISLIATIFCPDYPVSLRYFVSNIPAVSLQYSVPIILYPNDVLSQISRIASIFCPNYPVYPYDILSQISCIPTIFHLSFFNLIVYSWIVHDYDNLWWIILLKILGIVFLRQKIYMYIYSWLRNTKTVHLGSVWFPFGFEAI